MSTDRTESPAATPPRWLAFWERGGWWKAALVVVVYAGLFLLGSYLVSLLFGSQVNTKNLLASPGSVFFGVGLPILIGAVLLSIFITTIRWWRPLFAPQPIRGSWWMWIAVAIVAIPAVLRLIAMDYSRYSAATVIVTFLCVGLLVGFVEELLTRGVVVRLLRNRGYSERVVAVLSAALFAALHLVNAAGSGLNLTVVITVVYTFGFGLCMYLVMRVTGSLVWAMVLHAITDPTVILAYGGIDTATTTSTNPLLTIAGLENWVVIAVGLISIIFIRGRVGEKAIVTDQAAPRS